MHICMLHIVQLIHQRNNMLELKKYGMKTAWNIYEYTMIVELTLRAGRKLLVGLWDVS